jgi:hypothetical protein
MTTVRVFDPAMCCSTGICGPSIDPQLVRFAADLDWLKSNGVTVERFNLSQQPAAFVGDAAVKQALETEGAACLPLIEVNGELTSRGTYPTRDQLAAWAGIGAATASTSAGVPATSTAGDQTEAASGCCGPSTRREPSAQRRPGCC